METITVMKQALEALEWLCIDINEEFYAEDLDKCVNAIEALRLAIEQAEKQEPVAHMNQSGVIHEAGYEWGPNNALTPLYTAPPQRQPLTEEEIERIWLESEGYRPGIIAQGHALDFARAIEAKLKEKNA